MTNNTTTADMTAELISTLVVAQQELAGNPENAINIAISEAREKVKALSAALAERLKQQDKKSFAEEIRILTEMSGQPVKQVQEYVAIPLWQHLQWAQADFSNGELPDWGELMKQSGGSDEYDAQFDAVVAKYGPDIIGKGDSAIYPTAASRRFDLGDAHWRLIDFVRAPTTRPTNPYMLQLTHSIMFTSDAESLGDGIFARVKPETIGYEGKLSANEDTLLQCRAFIWDEDDVCRKVFKGLVLVSHDEKEYFSHKAGYGSLREVVYGDTVEIHPMVDVKEYNPSGRISHQLGDYSGIRKGETYPSIGECKNNWFEWFKPGCSIFNNALFDGARMIDADAPIGNLPVQDAMRIPNEAFKAVTSIQMGVRRKVAPGIDLEPFTFRAPWELSGMFQLGEMYTVHRDPALPDGTSTWSGKCVGYTRGNYFQVPTNLSPKCKKYNADGTPMMVKNKNGELEHAKHEYGVWEQGGGDFDGDDALVLPHVTNGGIILGFNDRSEEEQKGLREAAGEAGRKAEDFKKKNYVSGTERWKRQRQAAIELGMLDYRARKLLDSCADGRFLAAAMKPFIQAAVDRQKRNLPYPQPLDTLPKMKGVFATQLFSFIKKPDSDIQDDKTSWKHSWDLIEAVSGSLEQIINGRENGLFIQPEKYEALKPVCEWALGVFKAVKRQLMATTRHIEANGGYPRPNNFPTRQLQAWRDEYIARLSKFGEPEQYPEIEEVCEKIIKLRRTRPSTARAAEAILQELVREYDFFEQIDIALSVKDTQTFMKIAPDDMLKEFFASMKGYASVSDLPGVIVEGRGRAFKILKSNATSTKEMMIGGCRYGAGEVTITEIQTRNLVGDKSKTTRKYEVQSTLILRANGIELSRTAGSFQNFKEVSRQLISSTLRKADESLVVGLSELEILPTPEVESVEKEEEVQVYNEPVWDEIPYGEDDL